MTTLTITGQAIIDVAYTYTITDVDAFKQLLKDNDDKLFSIQRLYDLGILDWKTPTVQYNHRELGDVMEDIEYSNVYCDDDDISEMLEDIQPSQMISLGY